MKNILIFVKKHYNIIVFFILAILLLGPVFNILIQNNDELINFLNIYKMSNGLTIYEDTNVIITPLFFYVGEILFNILGNNIFVFRIYNLIISIFLYFIIYEIFKTLKINKSLSFLYTLIIFVFTHEIIKGGANYNIFSYVFFEIGLLIILKCKNGTKKEILQGIILFLIFFSNQKLSAGYFIAIVIYELYNKNFKGLTKELLISALLLSAYLIYLFTQNNLYNFINYTILGIGEFGNKNVAADGQITNNILIFIIVLTIILYFTLIKIVPKYVKIENKKQIDLLKTLIIFSLSAFILIVPICNLYHLKLAGILTLISFIYGLHYLIYPIVAEGKRLLLIILILSSLITIIMGILSIRGIVSYAKEINKIKNESPFYGGIIEDNLKEEIREVSIYIQNNDKNVIVLSTYSPFYSIVLNNLDNKEYDWPLRGNLGKDGEEGLINKIKKLENTQILLLENDKDEIYQFTYEVKKYIKENMKYIDKIQRFNIYETIN